MIAFTKTTKGTESRSLGSFSCAASPGQLTVWQNIVLQQGLTGFFKGFAPLKEVGKSSLANRFTSLHMQVVLEPASFIK